MKVTNDYLRKHYELYAKENQGIIEDAEALLDLAIKRPLVIVGNYCDYNVGEDDFPYLRISCYSLAEDNEIRFIIQRFEYGTPVLIRDLGYKEAEALLNKPILGVNTYLTKGSFVST